MIKSLIIKNGLYGLSLFYREKYYFRPDLDCLEAVNFLKNGKSFKNIQWRCEYIDGLIDKTFGTIKFSEIRKVFYLVPVRDVVLYQEPLEAVSRFMKSLNRYASSKDVLTAFIRQYAKEYTKDYGKT